MKVEYTEELEKLVMLYAECIISLIKASLNKPTAQLLQNKFWMGFR